MPEDHIRVLNSGKTEESAKHDALALTSDADRNSLLERKPASEWIIIARFADIFHNLLIINLYASKNN